MNQRVILLSLAALLTLPGCALQLGGGAGIATADAAPRGTLVAEGRLFAPRKSGPMLGVHAMTAVGESSARPLRLRSLGFAAGYHVSTPMAFPRGVGWEAAIEVGAGAPLREEWDGLGSLIGVDGAMLYRIWGAGDREPGFDTLSTLVDLALTVRGGVWSAPEGSSNPTRGEGSVGLSLRVTISTDLTTARPPSDEEGPPKEQTTTSPEEFE